MCPKLAHRPKLGQSYSSFIRILGKKRVPLSTQMGQKVKKGNKQASREFVLKFWYSLVNSDNHALCLLDLTPPR